jgi:hypothetical protein
MSGQSYARGRIRPEHIHLDGASSATDDLGLGVLCGGSSMTPAHEIRAEFRSTLGKFTLEAVFTVPATGITMLFGPSGR